MIELIYSPRKIRLVHKENKNKKSQSFNIIKAQKLLKEKKIKRKTSIGISNLQALQVPLVPS